MSSELTGALIALCGIAIVLTTVTSVSPSSAFRWPKLNIAAGLVIAAGGITWAVIT